MPGLLQPVAEPKVPQKDISIDFIVQLPKSSGNTIIWTMIDLFSKQVHFVPCQNIFSARTLAKLYVQHVYRLHRAPERMILGCRIQFTSWFWQEFLRLLGTTQGLSSSNHPETNGACEYENGVLEQYLRRYINQQQDNWVDLLTFTEMAYNNAVHSSTGFTPFKVATGQDFLSIPQLSQATPQTVSLKEWITQIPGQQLEKLWRKQEIIQKTG